MCFRGLTWITLAQLLRRRAHLAVHNTLVLLLFRVSLEPLPRKAAPNEVHQNVPDVSRRQKKKKKGASMFSVVPFEHAVPVGMKALSQEIEPHPSPKSSTV